MDEPTAIVVLGMHRSGTSALAGVLHQLGADVPDDLMPGDQYNQTGYWESKQIADFNDDLFKCAHWTWDKIDKFPPDWHTRPEAAGFRSRAIELLTQHFSDSRLFVLKDPRISILVPFWTSVLAEMKIRPVFVIIARDPREVAGSLAHRNQFPPEKSHLLWLIHTLEAERATRGQSRCFATYDQLLRDWLGCVECVAKAAELAWPTPMDSAAEKIEAMLSADLRHHRAAADSSATASPWAARAYSAISAASKGNESQLVPTLDEISKSLDAALIAFTPLIGSAPAASENHRHDRLKWELDRVVNRQKESEIERAAIAKIASQSAPRSIVGLDHLVPISPAIRESDGSWHGNAQSSRFLLGISLPPGKARVRATIRSSVWSRATICFDYGQGFVDPESVEVGPLAPGENRIDRVISVYRPALLARFEPLQDPGEFSLLSFVLEPATEVAESRPRSLIARIKAALV
jgi:hypothetical protein